MERWRAALVELGDAATAVNWRYGAFELDPTIPPEGVDARAYLEAKYDAATVAEISRRLAEVAAAEGLPLRDLSAQGRRPNTFAAHRLLTAAGAADIEVQHILADGLFRAYWADGADIGDPEVLVGLARVAGMSETDARRALVDGDIARSARGEEQAAQEAGIHAVPTFVFDGRSAVSGAQPPAELAQAVRRALAAAGS